MTDPEEKRPVLPVVRGEQGGAGHDAELGPLAHLTDEPRGGRT